MVPGESLVIELEGLARLVGVLGDRGFLVIGPTVRSGAIVYDVLESADDLPVGLHRRAGAGPLPARAARRRGSLRLRRRGAVVEAGAPAARAAALASEREPDGGFAIAPDAPAPPPLAFIGVRSCELHAIQIQDRVLVGGAYADADYEARRRDAFIVAVNCGEAGGTCFCVSMQTGPKVGAGHDLALTELLDDDGHRFLVEVGSERGAQVADELPARPAEPRDHEAAARAVEHAASQMGRTLDTDGLAELLQRNREHPRWDEVADRCLTCGNCTLVCPTCFCTTVEDVTDLAGGRGRAAAPVGLVLQHRLQPHARRRGPRLGAVALPAVDDAQALDVVGPVRHQRLRRLRTLHHVVPRRHRHHRGGRGDPRDGRSRGQGGRRCRSSTVEALAGQVPLLADLDADTLALVAGCASLGHFAADELLAREGAPADTFFAVRDGRVALELVAPARSIVIETLGPGEVCGWSWLFAPHRWQFDVRAVEPVRVLAFDAACLRGQDRARRCARLRPDAPLRPVMLERLQATRLRLVDVYRNPAG